MKKLILAAAGIAVLCAACNKKAEAPVEEQITPAQTLINRLQAIQDSGMVAFGHHDDLSYGHCWEFIADSSDVKAVTGDYPAIVNWDLGGIELGDSVQLDGVAFDYIRDNAIAHHKRGGINTFSWHLRNPATGGSSWDVSVDSVIARVINPADSLNAVMQQWIGTVADYLLTLRDENGELLPIVFRPWHEQTGEWFWWNTKSNSNDDFIALWQMTHNIFNEKGLNNVVWAYSPDKSNVNSVEDYMAAYPGDEYVDIMGADIYCFPSFDPEAEMFNNWVKTTLGAAVQMAQEHGKIAALTETGCEGLPIDNWYMGVLMPAIQDYPIAYITVWRNAYIERETNKVNHYYTPYPGHQAVPDFVEYYELPSSAFLEEIKEIK